MKTPQNVNNRWWMDVVLSVKPGTKVTIDEHWGATEVNLLNTDCVAAFCSTKHAKEFCKLNRLQVVIVK